MLTAFLTTLAQMARILLFLLTGYCLNRMHILRKETGTCISRLVTMVFLPAMLVHNNMMEFNLQDVGNYGLLVLSGGILPLSVLSQPLRALGCYTPLGVLASSLSGAGGGAPLEWPPLLTLSVLSVLSLGFALWYLRSLRRGKAVAE